MRRTTLMVFACIGFPSTLCQAEEPSSSKVVQGRLVALQKLADAELFATYDSAADYSWLEDKGEITRQEVLTEVIRRGGATATKWLKSKMESDYERRLKENEKLDRIKARELADPKNKALMEELWEQERLVRRLQENLEIFTALRRAQKKPDPLTISVAVPKDSPATTRSLPILAVRITNTDPEKLPIWFKFGGDGRGGRPARWRIEVTDEYGKPLALDIRSTSLGGIYKTGTLDGGASFEIELEMRSFVSIPKPGQYTVRVLYHNDVTIAEVDDLSGLIVFESKPFKLKVIKDPPKVVELKAGEREKAKSAIEALSETAPIRVVVGEFSERHHDFIDPKSPEGILHSLRWQAVPSMLDCLRDPKTSIRRRAWIVALLYVIVKEEELNPVDRWTNWDNVLTNYKYRGETGAGSSSGGKIDGAKQQKLVERWLAFAKDYIEIKEAK